MNTPSKEELLAQAIRQRQSGDSYMSIGRYLQSTGADETTVSAIVSHVDLLEKNKELQPTNQSSGKVSFRSGVMGSLFIFLGMVLLWSLWGNGWFSTISLVFIVAGLSAFGGTFDR